MVVLLIHFKLVLSIIIIIITLSRVTLKKEEIIEQLIMNWITFKCNFFANLNKYQICMLYIIML